MMTRMKAHLCKLHDRFDAGFCGINIVGLGSLCKMDCFAYIEEDTNFLHLLSLLAIQPIKIITHLD